MLGDIAYKENQRRQAMTCYRHPKQSGPKLPKLTLMGIVNSDLLTYDHMLDGKVCHKALPLLTCIYFVYYSLIDWFVKGTRGSRKHWKFAS